MKSRTIPPKLAAPNVTVRVSGKLYQGHLPYLEQLIHHAAECHLWPLIDLANLEELDRAALCFLVEGESRDFGIASCPDFIRNWIEHERDGAAAA